jgi:hypothetical protein
MDVPILHNVYFQTNPENPNAKHLIKDHAYKLLADISSVSELEIGMPMQTGRIVGGYFHYDVALHILFASRCKYDEYMQDPQHWQFASFVLNGWKLEDSILPTVAERRREFVDHVLNGTERRMRSIDDEVPSHERVYADERVFDDWIVTPKRRTRNKNSDLRV